MQTLIYDHIFRIVKNTNSAREKAASQSLKKERWEQLLNIKAVSRVFQNVRFMIKIDHTRFTTCLDEDDGSDTTSEQGGICFFFILTNCSLEYILSNAHCWAKCSPDKLLYLSLTVLPQPNYRFQVPPQPFIRKKI